MIELPLIQPSHVFQFTIYKSQNSITLLLFSVLSQHGCGNSLESSYFCLVFSLLSSRLNYSINFSTLFLKRFPRNLPETFLVKKKNNFKIFHFLVLQNPSPSFSSRGVQYHLIVETFIEFLTKK